MTEQFTKWWSLRRGIQVCYDLVVREHVFSIRISTLLTRVVTILGISTRESEILFWVLIRRRWLFTVTRLSTNRPSSIWHGRIIFDSTSTTASSNACTTSSKVWLLLMLLHLTGFTASVTRIVVSLVHTSSHCHSLLRSLILHGAGRTSRRQNKCIGLPRHLHHLDWLQDLSLSIWSRHGHVENLSRFWIIAHAVLLLTTHVIPLKNVSLRSLNLLIKLLWNLLLHSTSIPMIIRIHSHIVSSRRLHTPHISSSTRNKRCFLMSRNKSTGVSTKLVDIRRSSWLLRIS